MRIIQIGFAAATLVFATNAQASNTSIGTISNIITLAGGQVLFNLSGSRSTPPACQTIARWAFDGTTVAGQQKLAILLTAHATGKQISVLGKATCDVWPDTESVDYLTTAD